MNEKILGIDCCNQEIIPRSKKLTLHTNCHPNTNGTLWGWIEGCTKNICWSNDNGFNQTKAKELINAFNK
jgi:hypothetical protein